MSCTDLYDISVSRCGHCPAGSSINVTIHQCDTSSGQTALKNSNSGAKNYIGTLRIV